MSADEQGETVAAAAVTPGQPNLFIPVSLNRISGEIVDQIRQLIYSGQIEPGTRLPTEREMGASFGVSRVTVREALRVLESSGLIEIRVGARGGAFVTAPTSERVGASLTDLFALSGVSAAEVTAARQVLDIGIVPIVCENATEEDITDLFELCDRGEKARNEGTYSVDMSAEFHIRLAKATHNRAIMLLVQSFREPILMSLERAHQSAPSMGTAGDKEHRALVTAIQRRDIPKATEIMERHLARTLTRVSD